MDTQKCEAPKLPHWARGLAWLVLTGTGITNLWGVESTKLNSEHEIVEALGKEAEEQKQEVEEGRKEAAAMARPGQDWTVPGIGLEMAWVRRGTFLRGSPAGEEGRSKFERQHQVTLSRVYSLGKYELAQGGVASGDG